MGHLLEWKPMYQVSSLSKLTKKEKEGTEEMTQWVKNLQWKHGTLSMDIQNPSKVRPAWWPYLTVPMGDGSWKQKNPQKHRDQLA